MAESPIKIDHPRRRILTSVSTLKDLGDQLMAVNNTLDRGEMAVVSFGVNATHDSIFDYLDYRGWIIRISSTSFSGMFVNNQSRCLSIGTTNGGSTYSYNKWGT